MTPRLAARWLAPLSSRWVFLSLAGALVASGAVPVLYWGGNHDVAWLLYVAGRVLDGAHLYRDIIEINPPLIVFLSIPAAFFARALRVTDLLVYNVGTVALAMGSVALAGRLLPRVLGRGHDWERRAILLLLLAALFPLAAADFGQREHILLALVLPYLCLSAGRAQGAAASVREGLVVGAMAGFGLALKPFYVFLWLAIEAYLVFGRRAGAPWKRAETLAVCGVQVMYLAAVLVLTPDYLTLLRWLGPVYASLLPQPLGAILINAEGVLALLSVLAIASTRAAPEYRALRGVLLVATAASLVAVLLQQKGWSYHYYPTRAEALIVLGVVLLSVGPPSPRRLPSVLAALPVLLLALDLGVVVTRRAREAVAQGRFEREVVRGQMVPFVRRYAREGPILALTVSLTPSFPLVNFSGADWALRFPSLWMIPALSTREKWRSLLSAERAPRRSREESYLIDAVTTDLVTRKPALIVVYAPSWGAPDLAGYFASADRRFAAALTAYQPLRAIGGYGFYVLRGREAR